MVRTIQLGMGWFPEQSGGLNRYYFELIKCLPGFGFEISGLIAGNKQADFESGGQVHSFALAQAPLLRRLFKAGRSLQAQLSEFKPDLLVSHFALYAAPVLLQKPDNLPWAHHFHGPWALEGSAEGSSKIFTLMKQFLENRVYRHPDIFIVLSSAFRDLLHQEFNVPFERIQVIPGGVDVNRFVPNPSQEEARGFFKLPNDRPVILAVRRLARRMGLENLLVSFDQVRKRFPDALLVVAGKGPLQTCMVKIVEDLQLKEHVQLLGYVDDDFLPLLYRTADVTIVPSITLEGFGLIAVEALACGVPVLVTPVGGLPEIVNNLDSGLVLGGNEVDDLSVGMLEFLKNRNFFPSGAECRTFVEQNFEWSMVVGKIASAYRTIL